MTDGTDGRSDGCGTPGGVEDRVERVLAWARRRRFRLAGYNPLEVAVRAGRSGGEVRVVGLAAEMSFFALLSVAPLLIAVGAGLGYLERFIGRDEIQEIEETVVAGLDFVFATEAIQPLVHGLLHQQRGGFAVGGLLVTLWLSSRVFTATIRALDLAYAVEERRSLPQQRALALAYALAAVVVVVLTLGLIVVGPLFGGGRALADWLRLGEAFAFLWVVGRWPVVFLIVVAFLTWLYRFGPNVVNTWRDCVPGAVLGVILWLLASVALRVYLQTTGDPSFATPEEEAIAAAGQVFGALVAVVVWTFVSSASILAGGIVNAELAKLRAERM
jgi:membrane protein